MVNISLIFISVDFKVGVFMVLNLSFKECYGSSNEADVSRVKTIYEELKIPRVFRNYEEESYLDIRTHIDQVRLKLKFIRSFMLYNFPIRIVTGRRGGHPGTNIHHIPRENLQEA